VTQFRRRSQILLAAAIALAAVVGFVVLRKDGPHRWDWHGREADATALAERVIAEQPPVCDARRIDVPVLGQTDSVCVGEYRDGATVTFLQDESDEGYSHGLLYSRLPFEPATPSSCTRLIGGPWSEIITNSYECPSGFRHHSAG
jgi:hypothetical protein